MTAPQATPGVLRRVETPDAALLVDLTATFEDLQTVLRCCERLVAQVGAPSGDVTVDAPATADDVTVEALWTTAVLSYARCFDRSDEKDADPAAAGAGADGPPSGRLSAGDVAAAVPEDVTGWHTVLLQLRDHYADPRVNPRERFSIGVAQGEDGLATGLAITSARQPLVDDVTVRQTGAIAYALSGVVDARISAAQQTLFEQLKDTPKERLDALDRIDVASPEDLPAGSPPTGA